MKNKQSKTLKRTFASREQDESLRPRRFFVLGSRLIYAPVLVRVCLVYVFGISGYAARQGRVLVLV